MRFISKYGRFGVQVRPLIQEAYATGLVSTVQDSVYALFHPWKLTPLEREMALSRWTFQGLYQEQDEVTIVPPDYRIGLFDSEEAQIENGWSDEVRAEVEATLIDLSERYDDIIVVRFLVPPPWPRYDEYRGTPQALVRRLVEDGHDLETVLAYEASNQNRPKVIEELTKAIDAPLELEEEETVVG